MWKADSFCENIIFLCKKKSFYIKSEFSKISVYKKGNITFYDKAEVFLYDKISLGWNGIFYGKNLFFYHFAKKVSSQYKLYVGKHSRYL